MTYYDLKLNASHDLQVGSDLCLTDEEDAVVQRLSIRLQFLYEEWFLDNSVGVPYTQFIFKQGSSIQDIYEIFRKEIINTDGVENIVSLELTHDPDYKGLRVDFAVNDGLIQDMVEIII